MYKSNNQRSAQNSFKKTAQLIRFSHSKALLFKEKLQEMAKIPILQKLTQLCTVILHVHVCKAILYKSISGLEPKCPPAPLKKSSQPTSDSSSIQTAEPIVKCLTILEMIFHHILSDLVSNFGKGPKRRFKKTIFELIFYQMRV